MHTSQALSSDSSYIKNDKTHAEPFSPPAYSLLLIDDDEDQLAYFQQFLSEQGFRVIAANSAYEGLAFMQRFYFDLLICDLRMPVLSGVDFIEQVRLIKTIPDGSHFPIIILSGCNGCSELASIGMGADRFCEKRYAKNNLMRHIRELLED